MHGHGDNPLRPRAFRRDVLSWLMAFLLLGGAIAGVYAYQHHTVERSATAAHTVSDDPRIVVLSYDRVVAAPDGTHVDARQLREQLVALRMKGFEPITLDALAKFYTDGTPLPAQSVLLMFEYGYLDIYRIVDPILEKLSWPATVSLITNRQAVKDTSFLYWDRLQRMVNGGRWDIAVQGYRAMDQIAAADGATTAPFVNQRVWLDPARRVESGAEYVARITSDLQTARQLVEHNIPGYTVQAYSYPYDSIALRSSDAEVQSGFEQMLIACCTLAFSDDLFGVNGVVDDPRHLHRLRVRGEWSTDELLRRIRAASQAPIETPDAKQSTLWVDAGGHAFDASTELELDSARRDQAWLAGSRWRDAWRLSANVEAGAGQFWLTQSDEPRGSGWRVGGAGTQLRVQVLERGQPSRTLVQFDVPPWSGAPHALVVTKRGAGLWVEWDGQALSELPVYIGATSGGSLAWSSWSDSVPARLVVRDLRLAEHPGHVVPVSAQPDIAEVQRLAARAREIGAIAVPVANVDGAMEPDRDLLRVLAHRYGWELVPAIEAHAALNSRNILAAIDGFDISKRTRRVAVRVSGLDAEARQVFERDTLPGLRAALRPREIYLLTPADVETATALPRAPAGQALSVAAGLSR